MFIVCKSQFGQVCNLNGISSTCNSNEGCGQCKNGYVGTICNQCEKGFFVTQGNDFTGKVDSNGFGVECQEGVRFWNKISLENIQCNDKIETILVLSPNDYYFYAIAKLENITSKYLSTPGEKSFSNVILIKITQCHCIVRIFLQNRTTEFDETLHVAWEWLPEGYGTSGRSGYRPV